MQSTTLHLHAHTYIQYAHTSPCPEYFLYKTEYCVLNLNTAMLLGHWPQCLWVAITVLKKICCSLIPLIGNVMQIYNSTEIWGGVCVHCPDFPEPEQFCLVQELSFVPNREEKKIHRMKYIFNLFQEVNLSDLFVCSLSVLWWWVSLTAWSSNQQEKHIF